MARGRSGRSAEAAKRFADRRRREDEAPRLSARVPTLGTLRLEMQERNGENGVVYATYVRHVMVDRAPALFFFPCGDTACEGGGEDATESMLRHLSAGEDRFEVVAHCNGTAGNAPCHREVKVLAIATRNG